MQNVQESASIILWRIDVKLLLEFPKTKSKVWRMVIWKLFWEPFHLKLGKKEGIEISSVECAGKTLK